MKSLQIFVYSLLKTSAIVTCLKARPNCFETKKNITSNLIYLLYVVVYWLSNIRIHFNGKKKTYIVFHTYLLYICLLYFFFGAPLNTYFILFLVPICGYSGSRNTSLQLLSLPRLVPSSSAQLTRGILNIVAPTSWWVSDAA